MGDPSGFVDNFEALDVLDPARLRSGDSDVIQGQHFMGEGIAGVTAANAAEDAAGQAQQAEMAKLAFLKEREALPQFYRDQSMQQYGSLFGLQAPPTPMMDSQGNPVLDAEGNPVMMEQQSQDQVMQNLMNTPYYQSIMSGQQAGEESIMRNAGATGGLRSGGANENLARYSGDLQNQAMLGSMQGLQGFTQMPQDTQNIANTMGNIGMIGAQGSQAAAQAQQAGANNLMSGGLGLAALAFSDIRLKTDIKEAGSKNGHNWYTWKWNDEAKALNLEGDSEGVMAHEVAEYLPDAVTTNGDYLIVNYEALEVTCG